VLDEVAKRVGVGFGGGEDRVDRGTIKRFDAATAGIGKETLGEHAGELGFALDQRVFEAGDIGEMLAAGKFAGGVDGDLFFVGIAPFADGIEALEGETERVDLAVAFVTRGIVTVLGENLTHRLGTADVGVDRRYVVGRRGGRRAQNIVEQPDAADDRRGFDAVGADREHAGLAEEAAALLEVDGDAAKFVAGGTVDGVGQTVEPGEGAVDERVVGIEEADDADVVSRRSRVKS